ncbi:hypothetical protein K488DRAFT_87041 [Vararia minispora EC-137]|uniref:Uncharacterized protein n=1 Tax=Vararia minispora EC-137 TaxID=1314806 RepID=A0ACB8QHP3_9AGAM|nr:hypothetical protein K488DRAFT_87041 [Vararia minispora EC-137]
MAESKKRPSAGGERSKKRYRSDGTSIWAKRSIDGPGVWVTCVKGKEKPTVGELYDLFEKLAAALWPDTNTQTIGGNESGDEVDEDLDLEEQIEKEKAAMNAPRKTRRFANCQTNTPCLVFISCKPPIDPVKLVIKYVHDVAESGAVQTRYTQRLTPIINTVTANTTEIKSISQRALKQFTADEPERKYRYKIELRFRNHNTLTRKEVVDTVVQCVPEGWTVDLENPEACILIEVFKGIAGLSVVTGYYENQRFNVMEIAKAKGVEDKFKEGEGRMSKAARV